MQPQKYRRKVTAVVHVPRFLSILSVLLMFSAPIQSLRAADAVPVSLNGDFLCNLITDNSVSYRTGAASWISQPAGAYPAVLPLHVKSGKSACRLKVGTRTVLECSPGSEFDLKLSKAKELILSLTHGSLLYSVPNDVNLKIQVPAQKFSVVPGAEEKEESAQTVSSFDVGIIKLIGENDSKIELANIRGIMTVTKVNDLPKEIKILVGKTLDVSTVNTASSGPFSFGTLSVRSESPSRVFPLSIYVPKTETWQVVRSEDGMVVEPSSAMAALPQSDPLSSHPDWVWCRRHNRWEPRRHNESE